MIWFCKILGLLYLTGTIILTGKTTFIGVGAGIKDNYIQTFSKYDIFIFLILFVFLYFFIKKLSLFITRWDEISFNIESDFVLKGKVERIFFICCPSILFIAWLPYFLTFYPGTGMQDEVFGMHSPRGVTNQPLYYDVVLREMWKLGKFVGNETLGLGAVTLIQAFIMIFAISYLLYWLYKKGAPKWFISINFLLFSFLPVFPNYAFCFAKDKLFAVCILLISLLLYDFSIKNYVLLDDKKWRRYFVVLGTAICLLRSNGSFVVFGIFIGMFYLMKKNKTRLLFLAGVCLLIGASQSLLFHHRAPFKEAVAIPLQQVARTVALQGTMTVEQKEIINKVLPYPYWHKLYRPGIVDFIKWNQNFNEEYLNSHKTKFLKTHFRLFFDNFKTYVDAYLLQTYGFWSLFTWDKAQTVFTCAFTPEILNLEDPGGKVNDVFNVSKITIVSVSFKEIVGYFMQKNVFYLGAGTCAWIMVASLLTCLFRKQYGKSLAFLPVLLSWFTLLLATPIAFAFRYAFAFALCMPLVIALPFLQERN